MVATPCHKGTPLLSNVFPLDPANPLIPVDVLLEGPKGRQFIRMAFDTGATFTIAPVGTLRAIGYDPATSTKRIEFIAAGSMEYRPLVKVRTVQALGVKLRRLEIVCHDLPPQSPVRGLLGLNFLKQIEFHVDFPHRRLTIVKRS